MQSFFDHFPVSGFFNSHIPITLIDRVLSVDAGNLWITSPNKWQQRSHRALESKDSLLSLGIRE